MSILDYIPEGYQNIRKQGDFFPINAPMSGADMANGSFAEEAVMEEQKGRRQNLLEAAREEARRQDPTLNYVQRELARGLLGNKLAYMTAQGAGDKQGMMQAATAADAIREQGRAIGWDGTGYGSDVSYQDAVRNLADNDTRAINNMFYGSMTPNDYYQKTYNDLVGFGVGRRAAEDEAQKRTDAYLSQRMGQMLDAFQTYGTDSRGAINQNGLRILSMMGMDGSSNPSEVANFLAKMNPSPVQNWNFENALITAENAQNNALTRMDKQAAEAAKARREGYQQTERMANLQNDLAIRRAMVTAELNRATKNQSNVDAFETAKWFFGMTGLSDEEAEQAAAQYMLGRGGNEGNRPGSKKDGSGMNATQTTMANALINYETEVQDILSSGKPYEDGRDTSAILALKEHIDDMIKKGMPQDAIEDAKRQHEAAVDQWEVNHGGRGVSPWPHERYNRN